MKLQPEALSILNFSKIPNWRTSHLVLKNPEQQVTYTSPFLFLTKIQNNKWKIWWGVLFQFISSDQTNENLRDRVPINFNKHYITYGPEFYYLILCSKSECANRYLGIKKYHLCCISCQQLYLLLESAIWKAALQNTSDTSTGVWNFWGAALSRLSIIQAPPNWRNSSSPNWRISHSVPRSWATLY